MELRQTAAEALMTEKQWSPASHMCQMPEEPSCPPNKYRQATGECNNVIHSHWGSRGSAFLRMMNPQYVDGEQ